MPNMTKIKLGLIPDRNMYIFFGKGMRSGVCYISNKANNNYLKSCNPKTRVKTYYILRHIEFVWLFNV